MGVATNRRGRSGGVTDEQDGEVFGEGFTSPDGFWTWTCNGVWRIDPVDDESAATREGDGAS
jgi:hypothetical protein